MTDVGLRVRRSDGYVETTITTKLSKMIGEVIIPVYDAVSSGGIWRAPAAANGGVTIDEFQGGTPFFYFLANGQRSVWGMLTPSVLLTGNSIAWNWRDDAVNYHVRSEMWYNTANPNVGAVGGVILKYGIYS